MGIPFRIGHGCSISMYRTFVQKNIITLYNHSYYEKIQFKRKMNKPKILKLISNMRTKYKFSVIGTVLISIIMVVGRFRY